MKYKKGDIINSKVFTELANNPKIEIACYSLTYWRTLYKIAEIKYKQ